MENVVLFCSEADALTLLRQVSSNHFTKYVSYSSEMMEFRLTKQPALF